MDTGQINRLTRHAYTLGRLLLGGVFIYASWSKLFHPAAFSDMIANYQILPPRLVGPVALTLPWFELVSGVCLVIHRWTRGSALLVSGMMLVFLVALGLNAWRGLDVACGCFTLDASAPASMWIYLLRDTGLLILAVYILLGRSSADMGPTSPQAIP